MNGLLAAQLAARQLDGAVGDDFVGVHVGLRTAAGLPDAQREMLVQLAGQHFVRRPDNQVGLIRRQQAEVAVHQRRRLFQHPEGVN